MIGKSKMPSRHYVALHSDVCFIIDKSRNGYKEVYLNF